MFVCFLTKYFLKTSFRTTSTTIDVITRIQIRFDGVFFQFQVQGLENEPRHEISNNVVGGTSKSSDQPAHTRSLIRAFARRLNIL